MIIIPAIDIIEGKCVRLTKGDYGTKKVYNENPLEMAKQFEAAGIEYLHLVDLDGAKSKHIVNHKVLNEITSKTKLKVDFGGGIKTDADIRIAFENGASQITGGSVAVAQPELFLSWLETYGAENIILGADFQNRKIATSGWFEQSELDVVDFIKAFESKGVEYVIYKEILAATKIKLIASGGVSSLQDLETLKEIGCDGAIIGKAIYEGKISLKELNALC
jgi:phosphoribosylformimino-5-aminoimidazole carboxamide ribotide isomerase